MKPMTSDHPSMGTGTDPFLSKLTPPPREVKHGGCSKFGSKCISCRSKAKVLLKCFGVLLAFHLLNVLLAIGGVVFAAMILVGLVLTPVYALFNAAINAHEEIDDFIEGYLGCMPIGFVCINLVLIFIVVTVPSGITFILFQLSSGLTKCLAHDDVRLTNFVMTAIPSRSVADVNALEPQYCVKRFIDKDMNTGSIFSVFTSTHRGWAAVLYLAVLKVIIGALSAIAVTLSVVQPVIVICTGGNDLFVVMWMAFDEHPYEYVAIVLSLWIVGAVGLVVVATLSVKLTCCVCGEWTSEKPSPTNQQDKAEAVALTPAYEPSATSFTELESSVSPVTSLG